MLIFVFLIGINLPIKMDVKDIKKGEVRLETLEGKLVSKRKFDINKDILETELQIDKKIEDPFLYRVVVKSKKRRIVKSLVQVSPFPLVALDVPEVIEQGVEVPVRIFLRPISIPLEGRYSYTLTIINSKGRIVSVDKGILKNEKTLKVKIPGYEREEVYINLAVENSYTFIKLKEKREIIPRRIKTFLVTDKPIYQPSQTVHIRTLSLYSLNKKPLKKAKLLFKIVDPSSNIVFKKSLKTNDFGIAYTNFLIADEVKRGTYRIEIYKNQEKIAEKTFEVKRYVLPKFNISLKTEKDYYTPLDTLQGELRISYFFQKPVAGGKVEIKLRKFEIGFEEIKRVSGYTDENGVFRFKFELPDYFAGLPLEKGGTFVFLDVSVEDKTGHREEKSFERRVVANPVDIYLIPSGGRLIKGIRNKMLLFAFYADGRPAKGRIEIKAPNFRRLAETEETGFLSFYYTPENDRVVFDVSFKNKEVSISDRFEFSPDKMEGEYIFLVPKSITGRVGDKFYTKIYTSKSIKKVYVDIIKEGLVYLKKSVSIENGKGVFETEIGPELSGSFIISAYGVTGRGNIIRDRKLLYFRPADELFITVEKRDSYLPGEEATIKFKVCNREGKGVISALCVSVVDEAVYALSLLHPGLERVFFEIEKEILKPRYEIHQLRWTEVVRERRIPAVEMLLSSANQKLREKDIPIVLSMNYKDLAEKFRSYFSPIINKLTKWIRRHYSEIQKIERKPLNAYLINKGVVRKEELLDPWENEIEVLKKDYEFYIRSAGPDGEFGTSDDLEYKIKRWAVKVVEFAAVPRAEAPLLRKKSIMKKSLKKEHVRRYFPETFLFEPSLITDSNGEAYLKVRVPDAITTYRMTILASSEEGLLGSAEEEIKIFKPLFVEPDIPLNLIRDDEVSLRIGLYNYTPKKRKVRLNISTNENIKVKEKKKEVLIPAEDVKSVYVRVKAVKAGKGIIRIEANSEGVSDIVEKEIVIVPPGIKKEISRSGILDKEKDFTAFYPHEADKEARKSFVRIYPGALSQVLTGLEQLLRVPFGCFEQTSSVTYPNILILDYIRTKGMDMPEIEMRATEYIGLGYQRLLSFEVEGGGFSWFGTPPANKILTAYGLREFNDMKKVYDIDENIIKRTLRWLLSQQEKDGSFKPDKYSIQEEVTVGIEEGILPTAYITWSLSEIGYQGKEIDKARKYLKKHLDEAEDNYELALLLNAFVGDDKTFEKIYEKLKKRAKEKDDMVYWESRISGVWRAGGISKTIETTALVGNALLRSGKDPEMVKKIIHYLYHVRSPQGHWYTTQPTILALKDIIAEAKREKEIEGILYVEKDGIKQKIKMDKENQKMKIIEFDKNISLRFEGKGAPVYDFVTSFYTEAYPPPKEKILEIKVEYNKKSLRINDMVKVKVEVKAKKGVEAGMVIVDLGIPPGFSALSPEWEEMVSKGVIKRYEITSRQIIVYLERVGEEPVILNYHLRANFPLKVKGTASRVYEYYNPENTDYALPFSMEVKE